MAANANESAAKRSGHWAVHHVHAVTPGAPSAEPSQPLEVRPQDQQADDERGARHEREDDEECDEPLAHEPSLVLHVVGARQALHERGRGRRRRPEGEREPEHRHEEAAARRPRRPLEAALQEDDGLGRHDRVRSADEALDRRRVRKQRENAENHERDGRDREEERVRERLRHRRHVVLARLRDRTAEDARGSSGADPHTAWLPPRGGSSNTGEPTRGLLRTARGDPGVEGAEVKPDRPQSSPGEGKRRTPRRSGTGSLRRRVVYPCLVASRETTP